jgi:hypothetical protein
LASDPQVVRTPLSARAWSSTNKGGGPAGVWNGDKKSKISAVKFKAGWVAASVLSL